MSSRGKAGWQYGWKAFYPNRRVLGYDNQHGYHHRHCFGEVTAAEFESFEATEERFQAEWYELLKSRKL